tara:strand:- start:1545 stop:2399 length:855 start_codon:yes stop_codon:yes gene_type:complete
MGYGDDLLVTALASKIKQKYPQRQIVIGIAEKKHAYHSPIYDHNPNISDCRNLLKNKPIHIIDYHQWNRPYIDYKKSTNSYYVWNKKFKPVPGEIFFSKKELSESKKIVDDAIKFWNTKNNKNFKKIIFLETSSTKINDKQFSIKHQNKDWGYNNWMQLAKELKNNYLIIQSVHEKTKKIKGVFSPISLSFRQACAVLQQCDIYVGPEGGFGHVAAALRKKAVIYFGGWISPENIGYDFHENIYFDDKRSPCGQYGKLCDHCATAREKITVDIFLNHFRNLSLD